MQNFWNDTIVAPATAQGAGALAIVRVSGERAIAVVDDVLRSKKKLANADSHTAHFGNIMNGDDVVDEVVVTVFKNPKSFTGEDLVEICCHGSTYIVEQVVQLLVQKGCRLATAGEFTQRAYLNGKIDLSQAEAVADLIASETKASHRLALQQLKGGVSNEMQNLRNSLIHFTALLELELDFSDEDVEFADRKQLIQLIEEMSDKVQVLIKSFDYGNAIKNGVPVAIVGKPNAGKSSLLNVLLNENRAIVSNIPGTTRDTIEEELIIEGIKFRIIDTAGIRTTSDEIEHLGIQRTFEKAANSAVVLYLFDKSNTTISEVIQDYKQLKTDTNEVIICPTKTDLYENENWEPLMQELKQAIGHYTMIGISTVLMTNIEVLKNQLAAPYIENAKQAGNAIIVNQRHVEALTKAADALHLSKNGLINGLSGDLVSIHLKDAIKNIGSITGHVDVDKDILGAIFSKFCIGK